MVVIRKNLSDFAGSYGKGSLSEITSYADIIGYSIETDREEIRVELNPDRPDLLSFPTLLNSSRNFARPSGVKTYATDSSVIISLTEAGLGLRPFVFAFTATGNKINNYLDDLIDFQEKLHITVGKNRKKSSIGIHDMDNISLPAVFDSRSAAKTKFVTYDGTVEGSASEILLTHPKGKEYGNLIPEGGYVPLILDSKGDVLSMPPVINGRKSMIASTTSHFFVDVTGTDLHVCLGTMFLMMNFFTSLGYDVRLAEVKPGKHSHRETVENLLNRKMTITEREVKEFIGIPVKAGTVRDVLMKMGYAVLKPAFPLEVKIPPFRIDVMGPADILEDLAKGIGYDNIEPTPMYLGTIGSRNRNVEFANIIRELLPGAGFQEVITFAIGSESKYSQVSYRGGLKILNPKSIDFSIVRDRLSLNLMEFYQNNRNRSYPQNIFEIGEVIVGGVQESHIAISTASSKASFSEIKRVVDYLFKRLASKSYELSSEDSEMFIPGRSSGLSLKDTKFGTMGEVRPEILEQFTMKVPVALAELDLRALKDMYYSTSDR